MVEKCFDSNINCISNSMETFLTFSISNFDNTIINLLIKNKFPSLFLYFDYKAIKLLKKAVYSCDYMNEHWEKN